MTDSCMQMHDWTNGASIKLPDKGKSKPGEGNLTAGALTTCALSLLSEITAMVGFQMWCNVLLCLVLLRISFIGITAGKLMMRT